MHILMNGLQKTYLNGIVLIILLIRLKGLSIDERVRAWGCVCSRTILGLTVGFLLLPCSVIYTVENFSLFYLLLPIIFRFVFTRR